MSKASEIYDEAVRKSRLEHKRLCELWIHSKIDVCPCGMDMEREAIIAAFNATLNAEE